MREGEVVDDGGWRVGVSWVGPGPAGSSRYAARWYHPSIRPDRQHRFVLVAQGSRPRVEGTPWPPP